jgi:hypothetical protein
MTPEDRRRSALNAIAARWKKYRAAKQAEAERRDKSRA